MMTKKAKASAKKNRMTSKKVTKKRTSVKASPKQNSKKKAEVESAQTKVETRTEAAVVQDAGAEVGHEVGDIAPDFDLPDSHGKMHRLSDYRGKKVVLYFYPKDDTPGCTIEACDFRDKGPAIGSAGATVLGISPDHKVSHLNFSTKYNLTFPLLSDIDKEVAKQFGVWRLKNNYGHPYWGIERSTFVINEEGVISHVFRKVQVEGHVEAVITSLKR